MNRCTKWLFFFVALSVSNVSADVLHYQITTDRPSTHDLFVDTSVPDGDADPAIGKYTQPAAPTPPAPVGFGHDPFYHYFVLDDPSGDRIRIEQGYFTTVNPGHPSIPPGDYSQTDVFEFTYPAGQFSSDAFQPIVFPGASSATLTGIYFDLIGPFTITSVTLVPAVPEPTSLVLLAAGAGVLLRRRCSNRETM